MTVAPHRSKAAVLKNYYSLALPDCVNVITRASLLWLQSGRDRFWLQHDHLAVPAPYGNGIACALVLQQCAMHAFSNFP
jgi:hypothetical protein